MSEQDKDIKIENEAKEEFVSKKAYQDVSTDMHKYKTDLKETKALLNQIQAEQEAVKKEALAEQGRWEELYNSNQSELDQIKQERDSDKNKFVDYHKKNSVLQKIGGFKRDDYNKFIDVENVSMNDDGSLNEDSLMNEVDRIKQEYPELLKSASNTKLPNDAPKGNEVGPQDANKLQGHEKVQYLKSLIKKK